PQERFHLSKVPNAMLTGRVGLEGVIISPPEVIPPGGGWRRERRIRFLVRVEEMTVGEHPYQVSGGARMSILDPVQEYRYGDRIRGNFRLRRPRGYWNPGAFNYRRHAQARGFQLEGWGREGAEIRLLGRDGGNTLLRAVADLRETMLTKIGADLPPEEGGVVKAMVLGDQSGLSEKIRKVFLLSGTYHILVISGFQVGFFAGVLFFLARLLRLPPVAGSLLTVLGVVLYTLVAGGSPPVVRAALMTGLYLLAVIAGRGRDLYNTLALAAFILLLWNPLSLFDAGFQLTFAATGAILVAVQRWDLTKIARPWRWLLASLIASAAASLGVLPILALHFNRASVTGILANLVIVPLGGVVTALGMGYGLLLLFVREGFPPVQNLVLALTRAAIQAAQAFAALPLASVRLYTPTPLMVVTYAALVGLLLVRPFRRRGLAIALCFPFLLGQIGWKLLNRGGEFQVTFLDVGQGDAIFLELADGKSILVDGGGTFDDRFDIGEQVVAPYLWYRWIRRIDVVVLTHPQFDHMAGLRAVLENFAVGEVWESGYPSYDPTYLWLQDFVRERQIRLRRITRGDRIALGPGVVVTALHPPRPFFIPRKRRPTTLSNNNSLVLRIDHPELRLLLTGDIEEEGEASVLDAALTVEADLLKVPHHGSRGSSSASFLSKVRPRWAVIQAGDRNPFGHPHYETLARYAAQGIQVFRTERDGAVTFALRDGAVTPRTYREELGVWAGD
ncbi:MAG: DNA internalization-related competence protein ComEC/Rec2, partial [candidate division NC10 bacterium]|nr:DNA internalization-related competence protein ComEC/Rec2 [candidate division NC10 bacterium]